jgi:DNA-binding HxlR family transcriptional regulator
MSDPIKRLPMLPAERALKVISGRWKAIILYHLFDRPQRLSELQRLLPDVSQKVLIQQLREMEEHGIVHREVFRQVPPRVEYSATPLGFSFEPVLLALCELVAGMPSSLTKPIGSRTARSKPHGGIAGLRRRGCALSDDDLHCTPRC